ncbi:hypothetical protein ACJX0J_031594, partial [Zea mays]
MSKNILGIQDFVSVWSFAGKTINLIVAMYLNGVTFHCQQNRFFLWPNKTELASTSPHQLETGTDKHREREREFSLVKLNLFLIIASFLINDCFFLVRNISGYLELAVAFSFMQSVTRSACIKDCLA